MSSRQAGGLAGPRGFNAIPNRILSADHSLSRVLLPSSPNPLARASGRACDCTWTRTPGPGGHWLELRGGCRVKSWEGLSVA